MDNYVGRLNEYTHKWGCKVDYEDLCADGQDRDKTDRRNSSTLRTEETNFIGLVNHYCQKTKRSHSYVEVKRDGPPHLPRFVYKVVIDNKDYDEAEGKNKTEAKQNAAELAWSALQEQSDWDSKVSVGPTAPEDGAPLGSSPSATLFYQRVVIDGKACSTGVGTSKKEAKQNAAKNALESLAELGHQGSVDSRNNAADVQTLLSSKDNSFAQTNFIGLVNHYCQKTKRPHSYVEVRREGPPHLPRFVYRVVIDNKDYPEAEGKNKTEAKQNAAELAWSALQDQSDWDSKVSVRSTASEDGAPPGPSPSATLYSNESSSQNRTSNSSNLSTSQTSSLSSESETTTSVRESLEPSSQSLTAGRSESIIFADSSNPSNDQNAVKKKSVGNDVGQTSAQSRLTSEFSTNAVKSKSVENNAGQTSAQSRFTSEFNAIERLGKGGFGRVYKAKKILVDQYRAVKIVHSNKKALREVRVLSELHHRNIVRYYSCWTEDYTYEDDMTTSTDNSSQYESKSPSQFLYIEMELCDTKTLRKWIKEQNKDTLEDSQRRQKGLFIAQQIIEGVEYIHSKGLIHRDLKPENILFGQEHEVKIGDFGLVTGEHDCNGETWMERTKRTGTKSYMAPEQNGTNYDLKVDVFALGLVFFELLWKISTCTTMEKAKLWTDIRSQKFPQDFSLTFPQEMKIIQSMLCEKPKERPEAGKLKVKLEECAQTSNAKKNKHQENRTV